MTLHAIRGRTRYPGAIDAKALSIQPPDTISDLLWWIAAHRIVGLADGDPISSWPDLTGAGRHATQGTAGRQPTYKTGIINGLPVARFDGGDDLNIANMDAGSNLTWGFVFKPNGVAPFGLFDSAPNLRNVLRNYPAGVAEWWNNNPNLSFSLPNNVDPVYILLIYELTPTRRITCYRNGALVATATSGSTTGAAWGNPWRLGSINGTPLYNGDLAESFLYNRVLTDSELTRIYKYVNSVYGL